MDEREGHRAGSAGQRATRPQRRRVRVVDREKLKKTVTGTAVGNFMEWYDYGVYGFLATTLASVFFPEGSTVELLATFAVLAISFGVRPIGGIVFGAMADRVGRKKVLTVTITMMALGTTAIGVLPGYETLGAWAFVLLIACRVVQGFSTGGEYVDAMVFINEHSPDRRRGYWVSWLPVGTLVGYIAGSGLVTLLTVLLSEDAMQSWGWRIPFLLAAVVGMVGLYIRLKLEESPVFEEQQEDGSGDAAAAGGREREGDGRLRRTFDQFRQVIVEQWRPLLTVIGLVLVVNVLIYMLTGYIPSYLKSVVEMGNTQALLTVLIVLLVVAALVTASARLSDRVGRRPVMFVGCGLLLVTPIPAFLLMQSGAALLVFLGVLLVGLMLLCFTAVEPATLPGLFPTRVRGLSVSIGYNVSVTAFGGTTPLIVQALYQATGSELLPAYYLMVAALVGIAAVYAARETAGKRLPGTRRAVESEQEADEIAEQQHGQEADRQ